MCAAAIHHPNCLLLLPAQDLRNSTKFEASGASGLGEGQSGCRVRAGGRLQAGPPCQRRWSRLARPPACPSHPPCCVWVQLWQASCVCGASTTPCSTTAWWVTLSEQAPPAAARPPLPPATACSSALPACRLTCPPSSWHTGPGPPGRPLPVSGSSQCAGGRLGAGEPGASASDGRPATAASCQPGHAPAPPRAVLRCDMLFLLARECPQPTGCDATGRPRWGLPPLPPSSAV